MVAPRTQTEQALGAAILPLDDVLLSRYASVYGTTPGERAASLAEAILSTPGAAGLAAGSLILRTEPRPLLVYVGASDDRNDALLAAQVQHVNDALTRLLPVPYTEVERACDVLASRLRERLGDEVVARCRLVGVPRGGLIVAGLLAYFLGLPASRVGAGAADDGVTVVVDDCALSGARTRRWLRGLTGSPVVLAHLHSHPDLRAAVERDDRVRACVAAVDLHDYAPAQHGDGYEAWRSRWAQRSPDDYWTGQPDHVCFPWNEPDNVVWDPLSGKAVDGWHVIPPKGCVKNRRGAAGRVHVCKPSAQLPSDVVWADMDEQVFITATDGGSTTSLTGTAADFWRALVSADGHRGAVELLSNHYAVDVQALSQDVRKFEQQLAVKGFWRPFDMGAASPVGASDDGHTAVIEER